MTADRLLLLTLAAVALSVTQPVSASDVAVVVAESGTRPMLDGSCDDPVYNQVRAYALGDGVRLFAVSDAQTFTLCIALPTPSFAALDLVLEPQEAGAVELHISAQLGERMWQPDQQRDWKFEPVSGWFSPVTPYVGMDGDTPRFRDVLAREIQFDRSRFSASSYKMRLSLTALGPFSNGRFSAGQEGEISLVIP